MVPEPKPSTERLLFVGALLLGTAALLVDSPDSPDGDFQLEVVDLAQWLRDRRPGLYIADLRPLAAYREYHLPQARLMTPDSVVALAAGIDSSATVVVYDGGEGLAARVARRARRAGIATVVHLTDGITQWHTEVLTPTLRFGATEAEREDFERVAALSRYFGGQPRRLRSANDTATPEARASPRGCGI